MNWRRDVRSLERESIVHGSNCGLPHVIDFVFVYSFHDVFCVCVCLSNIAAKFIQFNLTDSTNSQPISLELHSEFIKTALKFSFLDS